MFLTYQTVHPNGLGRWPFPDGACGRTGLLSSAFQHVLAFAKRMNRVLTAGDCAQCESNVDYSTAEGITTSEVPRRTPAKLAHTGLGDKINQNCDKPKSTT
jgi:hypothetical protein